MGEGGNGIENGKLKLKDDAVLNRYPFAQNLFATPRVLEFDANK
jgi:hypothetical protein